MTGSARSGRVRLAVSVLAVVAASVALLLAWETTRTDEPPSSDARFGDYCEVVVEQRPLIGAALQAGPTTGLIRALPAFRALAAEAPDDIADDWSRVIAAVEDLVSALEDAGVDPSTYDRDAPDPGLDAAQKARIDAAATALGAPATRQAFASVEQQARDVCGSPLSL